MTLQNEYVVMLFLDGERYDVIYAGDPKYFDEYYPEFEKSLKTLKRGDFERVSSIINYDN